MISLLRGVLAEVGPDWVLLETGGVGFQVFVPGSTLSRLPRPGQPVTLHTHLHVREDALVLFGFTTREELETFKMLLTVTGVGPKVAMGALSGISPEDLVQAVAFQDEEVLRSLPGVGKKTAQRIILELKEKVGAQLGKARATLGAGPAGSDPRSEAVEALVALGYGRLEAGQAVERCAGGSDSTEELVRRALREIFRAKGA